MTKAELVAMINALPGPKVTGRARKDVLMQILVDREENVAEAASSIDIATGMPMKKCKPCAAKVISITLAVAFVISIIISALI